MSVHWFRTSRCFRCWQKNLNKTLHNSLLSCNKTIFPCLNWLITLRFQNMFWKNISWFLFRWKTCTKYCTSNCNITCQKTSFDSTLRLIKCFQFQNIIWKMEERRVSNNIRLKIWQQKFWFWFCSAFVYSADFLLSLL